MSEILLKVEIQTKGKRRADAEGGALVKRRREEQIMISALAEAGLAETPELKNAVAKGLKAIRVEKYDERMKQKQKSQKGA